jgi:hypothetical protein
MTRVLIATLAALSATVLQAEDVGPTIITGPSHETMTSREAERIGIAARERIRSIAADDLLREKARTALAIQSIQDRDALLTIQSRELASYDATFRKLYDLLEATRAKHALQIQGIEESLRASVATERTAREHMSTSKRDELDRAISHLKKEIRETLGEDIEGTKIGLQQHRDHVDATVTAIRKEMADLASQAQASELAIASEVSTTSKRHMAHQDAISSLSSTTSRLSERIDQQTARVAGMVTSEQASRQQAIETLQAQIRALSDKHQEALKSLADIQAAHTACMQEIAEIRMLIALRSATGATAP